ncbi:MAG TPA: LysE family translocator [Roseiarcus sp.]|nr:LysE family translocator [Roseiarcus sp.]
MTTLLAFLGVSLVVIVTPGPDTAVTVRNALIGGRAGGVATALGVAAGQALWALTTSIGIVALLLASAPLFLAIKYGGAAYLIWLGLRGMGRALQPVAPASEWSAPRRRPRLPRLAAFRQGLVSDLGNPKMAVFFASFLPQFAPAGPGAFAALLFFGGLFAAMTFLWLALYSALVARAGDVLRRPALRRAIEGGTGALLIGLGLRVAAEQR